LLTPVADVITAIDSLGHNRDAGQKRCAQAQDQNHCHEFAVEFHLFVLTEGWNVTIVSPIIAILMSAHLDRNKEHFSLPVNAKIILSLQF